MKGKFIKLISLILILTFVLSACGTTGPNAETSGDIVNLEAEIKEKDIKIGELETKIKDQDEIIAEFEGVLNPSLAQLDSNNLIFFARNVLQVIKDKDMHALSTFVHPSEGVRFTPYGYVDKKSDKVLKAADIVVLPADTKVYTWGSYDGTGFPIKLDFASYYDQFIYDEDFMNPDIIGNNVAIGTGNTINNIDTAYPNGQFVEFYFKGFDKQYAGIDWRSLTLVFEDVAGTWYLVGIAHGEWTI